MIPCEPTRSMPSRGITGALVKLVLPALAALVGSSSAAQEIRSIQEIRLLPRQEAAKNLAVHVSGTCIYASHGELFIHDGTHGIWVSSLTAKSRGLIRESPEPDAMGLGQVLEIEGVTDPGSYARQILPITIRRTGRSKLPVPRHMSAEQLIAGNEDGQYVELEGVVQDVQVLADRTVLTLVSQGISCSFSVNTPAAPTFTSLVDAQVSVVGAFAPDHNNRSEAVLPKIVSSTDQCIRIVRPPPADPFESPRVLLDDLRGFSPDVTLFHRKVTSGVITFVRPGEFFFLQEGATSVRVSSEAQGLQPGWRVDVAGFIDTSQHLASLKNGIVRQTGSTTCPPLLEVRPLDLIRSASWKEIPKHSSPDLSGHRVRLRGTIRRIDRTSPLAPVAIWLESDNLLFPANLPPGAVLEEKSAAAWQIGAEAEVTGACELEFRGRPDPLGLYDPVGFHLWLASPDALAITRPAPWWTTQRLRIALSATALAALIAIGGAAMLRRQIKRQVAVIGRELETSAIASERERMARDLHDTLEQHLTGVAMQMESLAKSPLAQTPDFKNRLTLASRMLHHCREEARRSVWDLRNRILENHGFAAALESLAASTAIDGGPLVTTSITGSRVHLPSAVTYQLLRMTQEALANALKHAAASQILISLEISNEHCHVTIQDDGRGFNSAANNPPGPPHFGLIGMRERASRIGAELTVISQPEQGCSVQIRLPINSP